MDLETEGIPEKIWNINLVMETEFKDSNLG